MFNAITRVGASVARLPTSVARLGGKRNILAPVLAGKPAIGGRTTALSLYWSRLLSLSIGSLD
jgi:hypothetical protein